MTVSTGPVCFIPGGCFTRGSALSPDEQPEMKIEISPFYMDESPVTNRQYAEFIADGGYRSAHLWTPTGWAWLQQSGVDRPNYWDDPVWSAPDVPVTGVTWWEALAFARWAGKTLSTIPLGDAVSRRALLIDRIDGEPLPIERGYPLRLLDFGLYGYKSVKGLRRLDITSTFELGEWERRAGYELDGQIKPKRYRLCDIGRHHFIDRPGEVTEV